MTDLTTEIITHFRCGRVLCCLGGEEWEEQFVAVVLVARGVVVGDLCPRCLSRPPGEAAQQFRAAADHVRRLHERLIRPDLSPSEADDELVDRLARLKQETAEGLRVSKLVRVLSEAGRLHIRRMSAQSGERPVPLANNGAGARPAGNRLSGGHDTAALVSEQADELARLGDGLAALCEWPITVDRVIKAERLALIRRYALAMKDLQRVVNDRYAAYLSGAG